LNDILDFARLESGQAEMKLEPVNVHSALQRAENLLAPKFHEASPSARIPIGSSRSC